MSICNSKLIISPLLAAALVAGCGVLDTKLSAPSRNDAGDRLRWSPYIDGSAAPLSLRPLNDLDIFLRCYSQLTGLDPDPDDQRIKAIKSLKLSGRYACRELFKSVSLNDAGDLESLTAEKRAILNRLHRLNTKFFSNSTLYAEPNPDFTRVKENILDSSAPALFFTQALLSKKMQFDEIFRGEQYLSSNRSKTLSPSNQDTTLQPTLNLTQSIFGATFDASKYLKVGDLLGITSIKALELNYTAGTGYYPGSDGQISFARAFGGGILGSPVYLQNNLPFPVHGNGTQARATVGEWDGGIQIGRKWSVAVFKDFLCQELPSLTPDDVSTPDFVSSLADAPPFRNSAACSACHASMDQLAGAIRNIAYQPHGPSNALPGATSSVGTTELIRISTSAGAKEDHWPFQPDFDYSRRPATGTLMYRASDGKLINEKFEGLEQLGDVLARQNDVYRCATKRYMEYFMGLQIPMSSKASNANKDPYLAELNRLSQEFKQHKNLNRLVDQILMSNLYGSK